MALKRFAHLSIQPTNHMISSFVIWDHGLQYIEEIKELVRNLI